MTHYSTLLPPPPPYSKRIIKKLSYTSFFFFSIHKGEGVVGASVDDKVEEVAEVSNFRQQD